MNSKSENSLRIFLCHSSTDKSSVRILYKRLKKDGFNPWLDEEDIFPGQDWDMEITKAVRNSDIVVICISRSSITKPGYVQKEIKFALNIAEEKPDGVIFIIPARIEECEIPDRLKRWQCVDLFKQNGYGRLLSSLRANLSQRKNTSDYAEDIGTRIQSGLATILPDYSPISPQITSNSDKQVLYQLTILLVSTGDHERDKRRIKTIYGILISYDGQDRFSFQILENGISRLIDFPGDTTKICTELLTQLEKIPIARNDFRIEPILFM